MPPPPKTVRDRKKKSKKRTSSKKDDAGVKQQTASSDELSKDTESQSQDMHSAHSSRSNDLGSTASSIEGQGTAEYRQFRKNVRNFINEHMRSGDKAAGMSYSMEQITLISAMIDKVKEIVKTQEMLVNCKGPIVVAGDIHGQFRDLKRLLRSNGAPPTVKWLFLGDYVDRGESSLECIALLLAYKSAYPGSIILLRGNHECENVNKAYGFFDEMHRRGYPHLYKELNSLFNYLPLAATISNTPQPKILCMHGGISKHITSWDSIKNIKRPLTMKPPKRNIPPVAMDLLWADPDQHKKGYNPSKRGVGGTFGLDVLEAFCGKMKLDVIVRGHQVVPRGFDRVPVGNRTRLVTVFSAPNYCGELDNCAAVMLIDDNLRIRFQVLEPIDERMYVEQRKKTRQNVPRYDDYPEQQSSSPDSNIADSPDQRTGNDRSDANEKTPPKTKQAPVQQPSTIPTKPSHPPSPKASNATGSNKGAAPGSSKGAAPGSNKGAAPGNSKGAAPGNNKGAAPGNSKLTAGSSKTSSAKKKQGEPAVAQIQGTFLDFWRTIKWPIPQKDPSAVKKL